MPLDSTILGSFFHIVEAGGFTRAAEKLGITQPSISQQIRRLEAEVGRPLLHREGQGVGLTREGERLLPLAAAVVRAMADAEEHLREPFLSEPLRIGVSFDIAGSQLSSILSYFRDRAPGARLKIETGLSPVLSARLRRGEFDIVLGKRAEAATPGRVIWLDRLCWAVCEDHLDVTRRRPLPLVLPSSGSLTSEVALAALRNAKIDAYVVLRSDCGLALRAGVLAGLGVAVFGARFMPAGLRCHGDVEDTGVLPELPQAEYAFETNAAPLPPHVEAFVNFLIQMSPRQPHV